MTTRNTRNWLALGASSAVILTGGAFAAPAIAQEAGDTEIVVTAQRREQTLTEVPVSVQAFSGSALEQAQVENVTDLQRVAPSVAFSAGFSPSSSGFLIRGISSRIITGSIQPSSAVVVDGVPLVRQGEFVSELSDIERVEVLRGPQGTLFGKNATAGVLNIVTHRPSEEIEAEATVGYTTDDEASVNAMLNAGGDNTWVRVNAFWRDLDPLFDNLYPGDNDLGASESWGLQAKLDVDITPDLNWLFTAGYRELQNSFGQLFPTVQSTGLVGALFQVPALGYTPTRETDFANVNTIPFNETSGSSFVSELNWQIAPAWTLTSITGYRAYDEKTEFDVDGSPIGVNLGGDINLPATALGYPLAWIGSSSSTTGPFENAGSTKYWSQEVRLNYSGDRLNVIGGLFYQTVEGRGNVGSGAAISNNLAPLAGLPGCGPATAITEYCFLPINGNSVFGTSAIDDDTWAVFADATFDVTDTVSVFGGLRYTHEEMNFNLDGDIYVDDISLAGDVTLYRLFDVLDTATGQFIAAPFAHVTIDAERSDNDLSGRAGIQWQPSQNQNFYISYARAYKGPGVDVDNATSAANSFVGPETGEAWEIGAKQRLWDGRVMLNVSVFDQTIQDIQVSSTVPGTIQTRLLNAGDIDSRGVELEYRVAVTDNLSVDGGVSYIDAEHVGGVNACYTGAVDAGDPRCNIDGDLDGTPDSLSLTGLKPQNHADWRYSLNLNWDQQLEAIPFALSARLGWSWQDDMSGAIDGDPLTIIPAYGVLDASVTLAHDNGKWDVTLFGKNLTDELVISTMSANDGALSRVSHIYGRDFHRYGGIRVSARY